MSTKLDFPQVIKNVYEEDKNRLRVDADVTLAPTGSLEVSIDQATDSIKLGDGTTLFTSTSTSGHTGLDVAIIAGSVTGTFNPVGLKNGLKNSRIVVTDIPTLVPASAFDLRNSISVRVWGTETVYFGDSAVDINTGYPKRQFEEITLDIQADASVYLYAVCPTAVTSELRIMEIG